MKTDYVCKATGVELYIGQIDNDCVVGKRSHAYYEIFYIVDGEVSLLSGDRLLNVTAGDALIISPSGQYIPTKDKKSKCVFARIPKNLIPLSEMPDESIYVVRPIDNPALIIKNEAAKIERELSGKLRELIIFTSVMRILTVLIIQPKLEDSDYEVSPILERVTEILEYIDNHYEEKITLAILSKKFFIGEFYLCRLFKEYTGLTIIEYLTELRIRKAKELLQNSGGKVPEIAKKCGFGTVSAFSKAFVKKCGISPINYRIKARK